MRKKISYLPGESEEPENKPERKRLSAWFAFDLVVFILAAVFSSIMCLTTYAGIFMLVFLGAIILTVIAGVNKKAYYTDAPASRAKKRMTAALRTAVYAVLIGISLIPYTMNNPWKWYYPVQRNFYLAGFSRKNALHKMLPKTVPLDAGGYEVHFRPRALQGTGSIDIVYYTDRETVEKYISKAESESISKLDLADCFFDEESGTWSTYASKKSLKHINSWAQTIEADGAEVIGSVVYIYGSYSWNTAAAIFNPDTGYVRFYY